MYHPNREFLLYLRSSIRGVAFVCVVLGHIRAHTRVHKSHIDAFPDGRYYIPNLFDETESDESVNSSPPETALHSNCIEKALLYISIYFHFYSTMDLLS